MSVDIYVTGFAPPDEKWRQMKEIWDACRAAKVPVPKEVSSFFNDESPDPSGVEVKLPALPWRNEYADGFQLDIDKIPKHVKILRFYRS